MNSGRLSLVVADHDAESRVRLVHMINDNSCRVLNTFSHGETLQEWIRYHPEVEAVFLDTNLLNLAKLHLLKAKLRQTPLVITTAHPEQAIEAFEADALDYILKPVTRSKLERALHRIENHRSNAAALTIPTPQRYPAQAGQGVVFVELGKTTYFEVIREEVWAHAGGPLRTPWKALREVEDTFPDSGLLRVHRHLLVRPGAILGMLPSEGGRVTLKLAGGEQIEASRGGAHRLRTHFGLCRSRAIGSLWTR